jgi:hypothetical protein
MSTELITDVPLALAPVADVGFVLQAGAVGAAVGGLVAARAQRRWPGADAARITAAWSWLGLAGGVAVVLVDAVGGLVD